MKILMFFLFLQVSEFARLRIPSDFGAKFFFTTPDILKYLSTAPPRKINAPDFILSDFDLLESELWRKMGFC